MWRRWSSLLWLAVPVGAQTQFRELTRSVLPPAASSALCLAAADIDGDGDPDLALGQATGGVRLFTNLCGGTFRDDSTRVPGPDTSPVTAIAVADVDRDGDADLVLATAGQERVWVQAAGTFRDETSLRLPTRSDDSRALVVLDADRDGDLDLLVANLAQDRLYLNDGQGVFTDGTAGRLPVSSDDSRGAAAVDFDRDGDLDVFVGNDGTDALLRNDGQGRFTDASSLLGAQPATTRAVGVADVNRDGWPDLIAGGTLIRMYLATGTGFALLRTGHPTRTFALGDVDGDGWVDMFQHGEQQTTIYRNLRREPWLGGGTFNDVPLMPEPFSAAVLADLDLDGDPDLVLGGPADTRVYLNDGDGRYLRQPDRDLAEAMRDVDVLAADDVDRDGDVDVLMSAATQTHAYHAILQHNDGTGTFALGAWLSPPRMHAALFADVTGDGAPEVVGATGSGKELLVLAGGFWTSQPHRLPLSALVPRAVAAGDVDGDGDADLVFGNYGPAELLLNDGSGFFTDGTAGRLPATPDAASALALVDLDGDRDLDLLIANLGRANRVLRNDGTGAFTDLPLGQFRAVPEQTRAVATGDLDRDGDADLVFGNWGQSRVYRNDPAGFVDVTAAALPALPDSTNALALGDVDGDLDLDLVLGNFGPLRLLLNDGAGVFTDDSAARLPPLNESIRALLLLDSDRDGDLDLFTAAYPGRPRLLANLTRQATAPRFAVTGCTYDIDFYVTPWRLLPRTVLPLVGAGRLATPLATPFGWFWLDPAQMVALPALQTTTGFVRLSLPVPAGNALRGAMLHSQALIQHLATPANWHLTHVVSERVGS